MIRFSYTTLGGFGLGLGLSAENVKRLKLGQPILINPESAGLHNTGIKEILILYGESEQAIYEEMKTAGFIGERTLKHNLED